MSDETKTCPACAEEIKAAAIKCKHCGHELAAAPSPPPEPVDPALVQGAVKFAGGCFTLCALCVFGLVLALFLLWPDAPTYAEGLAEGRTVGQKMKQTQEYTNNQIDLIIDSATKQNDGLDSKGEDFKRGWLTGVREEMRR